MSLSLAAMTSLSGCMTILGMLGGNGDSKDVLVTQAKLPSAVQPYPQIEEAFTCIRSTGALRDRTFVVGPFADSTGKINAVSVGATGAFMPQGGSASYITDAITRAGGRVVSTYFGAPAINVPAQYMVNGIFNSLDFGTAYSADVRFSGMGPVLAIGWAQLTLSVQLDEAGTRLNRQMSMIQRPVRYTQLGVGSGGVFGTTLITGSIAAQSQERLQFEALNGPIALGIADVLMREFPIVHRQCGQIVAKLLTPEPTANQEEPRPIPPPQASRKP
jgi:hypothetical protein